MLRLGLALLRRSNRRLVIGLAAAVVAVHAAQAAAQDSRADIIAAQQAEKAKALAPYVPGGAERIVVTLQRELFQDPNGFYPFFGSVYSGGGFTLGAGYRQFYGDRTHADVKGMFSFKGYKLLELSTDSLGHAADRVDFHARFGWRDATQVAYHGLGIDSPEDGTNFRMKQTYVGGDVVARPVWWVTGAAGVMVEGFTQEPGTGSTPSIEEIHTPATAPGLGVEPDLPAPAGVGRHRHAAVAGLRAARRLLRHRVPQLRRSRRHLQLRSPRRRGRPAHPDPARELGDFAARPHADDARRRRHRAVLPAAVARQRQHAARLFSSWRFRDRTQPADVGRVALDSEPARRWTWRSSTTPARSRRASTT